MVASASRFGNARGRAPSSSDRTSTGGIEVFTDRPRRIGNDADPSGAAEGFFMTDTIVLIRGETEVA